MRRNRSQFRASTGALQKLRPDRRRSGQEVPLRLAIPETTLGVKLQRVFVASGGFTRNGMRVSLSGHGT